MSHTLTQRIDYAAVAQRDRWLSHPVLGDPSFDAFQRHPGNPICRGVAGLEWPVNGFLFADPASGHWYLYVGHYPRGYASGPDKSPSVCTVFRSTDAGASWEPLGPIFPPEPFYFRGDESPVGSAPDVSVVYADGRYHMAYDWSLRGATWDNIRSHCSGVGYAWSDRPEGPFQRHPEPILRNDWVARQPILGKYDRLYATTLIRRADDWLLLPIMDSGPHYAWGLVGMIADRPEGPYRDLTPLFHVEGDGYQPPLMEYFPAFVHDSWVYAPSTSVARNRNFQMIQRAPLADAMRPEAWELWQHGSVWHGAPVAHEAAGIWGQTLSGFVDAQRCWHVMFPSKDADDFGTINLASRDWDVPYVAQGWQLGAHQAPALALLRECYADFALEAEFDLDGSVCFFWGNTAPLGPHAPRSNAMIHPLAMPRGGGLRLRHDGWEVVQRVGGEAERVLAAGACPEADRRTLRLVVQDGRASMALDGTALWAGAVAAGAGTLGVLVERNSWLAMRRFVVQGVARPAILTWLYQEALLGAGQDLRDWEEITSPLFRHGIGAVHRGEGGRAKWNAAGSEFTLWSPKGPDYGTVEVLVDGRLVGHVALYAPCVAPSAPVLDVAGLSDGRHAVVVRGITGRLVVDSLDAR
mgnify:CR=1 FL=1